MKKGFILVILLALFVLATAPGRAQEAMSLPRVEVDLWPEYDQPALLVIYHLTLPPSVQLPAEMALRIPASVGEPHAVAARQPDGALYTAPYEREVSGDWAIIRFRATTLEMQVEYYDPGLAQEGNQRRFTYSWPGDYAVDTLILQVQQPIGAQDLTISPRLGNTSTGADGLVYHSSNFGAVPQGETFDIEVSYTKTGNNLSASSVEVIPSAPIDANTAGRMDLSSMVPWILAGLGVLLIAGGSVWYWRSGRESSQVRGTSPRRRRPAAQQAGGTNQADEAGHVYCHQCGRRAGPGDRFCRTCGTALRV